MKATTVAFVAASVVGAQAESWANWGTWTSTTTSAEVTTTTSETTTTTPEVTTTTTEATTTTTPEVTTTTSETTSETTTTTEVVTSTTSESTTTTEATTTTTPEVTTTTAETTTTTESSTTTTTPEVTTTTSEGTTTTTTGEVTSSTTTEGTTTTTTGEVTSSTTTEGTTTTGSTTQPWVNWNSWNATTSTTTGSVETTTTTTGSVKTTTTTGSVETTSSTTKTTGSTTWSEWENVPSTSTSTSYYPGTTTPGKPSGTWSEWEGASSTTSYKPSVTTSGKPSGSWSEWDDVTSTTTLTSTITETYTVWPVPSTTESAWAPWSDASPSGECVIKVVTSYGEPTWIPTPAGPPSSSASTTSVEQIPSYTTTATTIGTQWADIPAPSSSSTPPKTGGGKGGAGLGGNGDYWGMTYSPYTASSGCKDREVINKDIKTLASKGFSSVRVYSTDCNTLEYVGDAARENGIKMILGVFISKTGTSGAAKQVTDITTWAQWDLVELIVVGNEAIFNGFVKADELAGFIGTCKTAFQGAGYTGAVTTTEDLATWTSVGSQFCGVVDVVAANLYAFFNPDTTPDKAGDLISAQIAELSTVCGDKDTYVMESGWPSAGECNGLACPGKEEQATAIRGIQQANGAKVIFFSFEDELWKEPGKHNVEQHWGCSDVF